MLNFFYFFFFLRKISWRVQKCELMFFDVQLCGTGNLGGYLSYYRPSHSILFCVRPSDLFWHFSVLTMRSKGH